MCCTVCVNRGCSLDTTSAVYAWYRCYRYCAIRYSIIGSLTQNVRQGALVKQCEHTPKNVPNNSGKFLFFVIIHKRSGFTLNQTQNYHQSYFKLVECIINDTHFLYMGWACGHTVHDWKIGRSNGFQTLCCRHIGQSSHEQFSVCTLNFCVSKSMIWIFQDKCLCQSTLNNWDNSKVFLGWWFRR